MCVCCPVRQQDWVSDPEGGSGFELSVSELWRSRPPHRSSWNQDPRFVRKLLQHTVYLKLLKTLNPFSVLKVKPSEEVKRLWFLVTSCHWWAFCWCCCSRCYWLCWRSRQSTEQGREAALLLLLTLSPSLSVRSIYTPLTVSSGAPWQNTLSDVVICVELVGSQQQGAPQRLWRTEEPG